MEIKENGIYLEQNIVKAFRSNCPINCALEIIGDKWSLLIMRDILLHQKRTFKEFANSDEGIATNILSNRLASLEEHDIITKTKLPDNKKVNIYAPTNLGLDLIPVILELSLWCGENRLHFNPDITDERVEDGRSYQQNRDALIEQVRNHFIVGLN